MGQFVETYSEIKRQYPFSARQILRNLALSGLAKRDQFLGNKKLLKTPRIQFLYIHHSFKDELVQLDTLLSFLSNDHQFISHSDALKKILANNIDQPYIAISSDDGFKNNLLAAELLNKYNIKGCFFINPGLINEKDYNTISKHCKQKLHLPPIEFLNWDDVSELQKQGHEIGGHTMYHDNIANMQLTEFEKDLLVSMEILKGRCGEVNHFAFPYGRFSNFNEEGRKAVFNAGFTSCASAERGCHTNQNSSIASDQLCIRRDHVVLDWKLEHIAYFLTNNIKQIGKMNHQFPYKIEN